MYALKTINGNVERSVVLGASYSLQFEPQDGQVRSNKLAIVTGDDESHGYEISHDTEAFITTVEGKTVRVVNRTTKLPHAFGA